jgi:hypothetical protein
MKKDIENLIVKFVDKGFEVAYGNIHKDCNSTKVTPAAFGFSESGTDHFMILLPWEDDESKCSMLKELGSKCYEENLMSVALINDAVMKAYSKKPDPITEMPLTFPPSERIDCLTLVYIDFKDSKENQFKVHPYKVIEGNIVREEPVIYNDPSFSIDSLIMSCISYGFLNAAISDEYNKREILKDSLTREVGEMLLSAVLEKYPGAALGTSPKISEETNS